MSAIEHRPHETWTRRGSRPCLKRVKRRNTRSEQMFSGVPPTADIRRERRLRHAESPTLHLDDASMGHGPTRSNELILVNDSSTPSARLQIALQKRPLVDCQSGYDFACGNLNSKAVTTAGAMCSRVILRLSEPVVAIPGWLSSTLLALARKLRRRSRRVVGIRCE
jgi:hypothetical protein